MTRQQIHKRLNLLLWLWVPIPAIWLLYTAVTGAIGPDPAKQLVDGLGLWALRYLLACLAMTPLRQWTGLSDWIAFRRTLGLAAFLYVVLHLLAYLVFLFELRWAALAGEVAKRPYVLVGLLAFIGLTPLAITSTRAWQRRLGRRWKRLHQLIYPISIAALLHMVWVKKLGLVQVWPYAVILLVLLLARLPLKRLLAKYDDRGLTEFWK